MAQVLKGGARMSQAGGSKPEAVIFDMDGTLADMGHRRDFVQGKVRKDWRAFFEAMGKDSVNEWCRVLIENLSPKYKIVICTGRPSDYQKMTEEWLAGHHIPYDALFMRKAGDFRSDTVVKAELYERDILPNYDVVFVVDDRKQVVDMWRAKGLVCLQCEEGDF